MLEYATLAWNVGGTALVLLAALQASSVALAGFGFDSLIEIGARSSFGSFAARREGETNLENAARARRSAIPSSSQKPA